MRRIAVLFLLALLAFPLSVASGQTSTDTPTPSPTPNGSETATPTDTPTATATYDLYQYVTLPGPTPNQVVAWVYTADIGEAALVAIGTLGLVLLFMAVFLLMQIVRVLKATQADKGTKQ